MISYGGVLLPSESASRLAIAEARLSLADLKDWAYRTWPARLASLGWPWQTMPEHPVYNRLTWPAGASRFAFGYFICSDAHLNGTNGLRQQAYVGGTLNALPFVMNDGQRSMTTNLFMLPPRPLGQCGTGGDQYLLCLVDARYFWWDTAAVVAVSAGSTTWTNLFAALASALGISLTVDPIPAAYLTPPADFNTQYEYLPQQLDAAARSVGMRVVRNLDGTGNVLGPQNGGTAKARLAADLLLNPLAAGGTMALQVASPSDLPGVLPTSVSVVFPGADGSGNPTGANVVTPVTLASLALPQYAEAGTSGFTHLLYSSMLSGSGNAAQATAYATQAATDWYGWQQSPVDAAYNGVCNWTPTGFEDRIEWTHHSDAIATRVQRPPWNVRDETRLLAYGTYGSSNGGCGGLTVIGQNGVPVAGVDRIILAGNDVNAGPTDACGKTAIVQPQIFQVDSGGGGSGSSGSGGGGGGCDITKITIAAFGCVWVFDECDQTLYLFCGGKPIWCQPTGPCLPSGSGSGSSGSGNACLTYSCEKCVNGASIAFEVTPEGITAGSCTDFSALNKTFTLNYAGSEKNIDPTFCAWDSSFFPLCGQVCSARWILAWIGALNVWQLGLYNSGGLIAYWWASGAGWNCDSPLSFAFQSGSNDYSWSEIPLTIVPTCRQVIGPCGGGGGGSVGPTACCPGDLLCQTFSGTVSSPSGDFLTSPITPNPMTFSFLTLTPIPLWQTGAVEHGGTGPGTVFTVACDPIKGWTLGTSGRFCALAGVLASVVHCPSAPGGFELIFVVPPGTYGNGTGGFTLTVLPSTPC